MSTTRTLYDLHDDAQGSDRELHITRFGMGGGKVGLQLGIGGRYVQLDDDRRRELMDALRWLFPSDETVRWLREASDAHSRYASTPWWRPFRRRIHWQAFESAVALVEIAERRDEGRASG